MRLPRELYVNVAEYDFALPGKEQTDSRVSLLTGIHCKEVRRLRGAGAPVNVVPVTVSRTSRILARWLADPRYVDADGSLAAFIEWENSPSFEELVSSVTKDVRPRAVLDEWLDSGLVELDEESRVLCARQPMSLEAAATSSSTISAAIFTITSPPLLPMSRVRRPLFLERSVHYDGLSQELAERPRAMSRDLALEALQKVNREAHGACETDPGGDWRWNFGIYVYSEPKQPDPGEAGREVAQ